ncbi:hypothetical protein Y1Q_0016721 [Alligator mississippiensis]|uniref:Uncharacterized protein n=1 Tax=Alligator mississippiensis TaxID=8496 RepID=A0A151P026_ALLMI|nr:hypothetical protein Y1Q_0016721 [Alligator mississippiensis]
MAHDDRPKPTLVVSKPLPLEPTKSASPSPPPPLIPEVESVLLAAVTLVPVEASVDVDTKVELEAAPADVHEPFSTITTVPGALEPPMDTTDVDLVAEEEEAPAIPVLEPPVQSMLVEPLPVVVPVAVAVPVPMPLPMPVPVPPPVVELPIQPATSPSPSPPPQEEVICEDLAESNGVLEEPREPTPEPPACQPEPVLESPIAQPEELVMPNGLEVSGKPEAEEPEEPPESDVSPISEPEEAKIEEEPASPPVPPSPPSPPSPPPEEEEPEEEEEAEEPAEEPVEVPELPPPAPTEPLQSMEAAASVAVSVPKKKRRMKELNKKEAVGDLLDAFKEVGSRIRIWEKAKQP